MMHILQAQMWSCISAHLGLPHQKTKRETNDVWKTQLSQASWNRTILKLGSEHQINGRNYFSIVFFWFSFDSLIWAKSFASHHYQFNWKCAAHQEYWSLVLRDVRITGVWVLYIKTSVDKEKLNECNICVSIALHYNSKNHLDAAFQFLQFHSWGAHLALEARGRLPVWSPPRPLHTTGYGGLLSESLNHVWTNQALLTMYEIER